MEARRAEIYKEIMDKMVEEQLESEKMERLAREKMKRERIEIEAKRRKKEQRDIENYNLSGQHYRRFLNAMDKIYNALPYDGSEGEGMNGACLALTSPIWVPPCILGTAVYTIFGSDIPDKKFDED